MIFIASFTSLVQCLTGSLFINAVLPQVSQDAVADSAAPGHQTGRPVQGVAGIIKIAKLETTLQNSINVRQLKSFVNQTPA